MNIPTGTSDSANCPICEARFVARKSWLFKCPSCRFLKADLRAGGGADVEGVEALRRENFEIILDRLERLVPVNGLRLLEVGCARGWFLDAARRRGAVSSGIEPDGVAAEAAAKDGHDVRKGFFPDALNPDERFDVIVFNDVFEHLPAPSKALEDCRRLLNSGGLLVLNLPSSNGIFYQIGNALDRCGGSFLLERLWQKGMSSPHLSYFNPANLVRLAGRHGFEETARGRLKTIRLNGLWQRLRTGGSASLPVRGGIYLGVAVMTPLLRVLPNDITLHYFRKR